MSAPNINLLYMKFGNPKSAAWKSEKSPNVSFSWESSRNAYRVHYRPWEAEMNLKMKAISLLMILTVSGMATALIAGCGTEADEKTSEATGTSGQDGSFRGELKWKYEMGMGTVGESVVDGKSVYFVKANTTGATDYHELISLDLQTGERRWDIKSQIENSINTPAAAGGMIYYGTDDGYVSAVDADDGKEKWSFKTGGAVSPAPAVVDGVLYACSSDRYVYALDALSGKEVWKFKTGNDLPADGDDWRTKYRFSAGPAADDDLVFIGGGGFYGAGGIPQSVDGNLYAVDRSTGAEKWRLSVEAGVSATPVAAEGTLYVGSWDHKLHAVDATTGQEKWTFGIPQDSRLYPRPAVAGGLVFIQSEEFSKSAADPRQNDRWFNTLYAVDAQTGKEEWSLNVGDRPANEVNVGSLNYTLHASPVAIDGLVYFGGIDGSIHVVEAANGQEKGEFAAGKRIATTPSVVDGAVLFGCDDGNFYAVR
jgi:outer membrane protein assembly factor BamB